MITVLALSPSLDVTVLVRSLEVGGIGRPYASYRVPGGKALNAARVASRLGSDVRVVALLGGAIGDHVASLLAATSPSVELVVVPVDGETRMCLSIAADDSEHLTELYEPAPVVGEWSPVLSALDGVSAGAWVIISGSVPAGIDPDDLASALADAAERGVLVAVDTHGAALSALLSTRPALVKVNRAEAAEALGVAPSTPARTLAAGIRSVTGGVSIVTDGVAGSAALVPGIEEPFDVLPDPERGRFPVGSGDSVLGALVAALDRGASPREALSDAGAAGSANAAVPGAAEFALAGFEAARRRVVVTGGWR